MATRIPIMNRAGRVAKREFGGLRKKWQQDYAFLPIATHLDENFRIIVNLAGDAVLSFRYLRGGEYLRCQSGEPVEPDPDDTGGGTRCRAKFLPGFASSPPQRGNPQRDERHQLKTLKCPYRLHCKKRERLKADLPWSLLFGNPCCDRRCATLTTD